VYPQAVSVPWAKDPSRRRNVNAIEWREIRLSIGGGHSRRG